MKLAQCLPTPLRRGLVLALLAAAVALAVSSDSLHTFLFGLISSAETIVRERPVLGVIVFMALAAASAMLAFASSVVITPVAILVWGKLVSVLLLWSGWILGGGIAYLIGRYLGRPVAKRLSRSPLLERYENLVSDQTPFLFVLLFQFALPSEIPGYLLGLARYSWRKYLLALTLAELPYAITTIYLGESFLERQPSLLVLLAALVVVASVAALHSLRTRLAKLTSNEQP